MSFNNLKRAMLDLVVGYLVTLWLFLCFQHPGFTENRRRGIKPSQIILSVGFLCAVAAHWWLVDIPNAQDQKDMVMPLLSVLIVVANLPMFGGAALVLAFMTFSTGLYGLSIFIALLAPDVSAELEWVVAVAQMTSIVYYGFVLRTVSLPREG